MTNHDQAKSMPAQHSPLRGVVQEAQELGRRGFRVHPLKSKDQPYTKYSQTATSDPDAIAKLFAPFPHALIAIATGQGLVVIDDDRGLERPDPSMPRTATVKTPNRGWHYYYTCPTPVRNSASKIAPGVDVRGEGGYVVAPPSAGYVWDFNVFLETLPGVLLAACLRSAPSAGEFEPRSHVPAGERHDYLVRFAGWCLANEVADGLDTLQQAVTSHAFGVCEPWPKSEIPAVGRHIRSICAWVIAREGGER